MISFPRAASSSLVTVDGGVGVPGPFFAGGGRVVGLNPANCDFTKPFPAKEAPISPQGTVHETMTLHDGSRFVPSAANGTVFWLWKPHCQ